MAPGEGSERRLPPLACPFFYGLSAACKKSHPADLTGRQFGRNGFETPAGLVSCFALGLDSSFSPRRPRHWRRDFPLVGVFGGIFYPAPSVFCTLPSACLAAPCACFSESPVHSPTCRSTRPATSLTLPSNTILIHDIAPLMRCGPEADTCFLAEQKPARP